MMPLEAISTFFALLPSHEKKRRTYWIAYSGGMDSHVLLSLCHHMRAVDDLALHAIYVDHGMPASKTWALHTQQICAALQIDYSSVTLDFLKQPERNVEATWRQARYQAFLQKMQPGDVLLTAHHEEDQAETFLLQLFRGAGLKGLSAMPRIKPLGRGLHGRPLLAVSYDKLFAYAKENHLSWVQDPSNIDTAYTRNFIRHAVFPILRKRFPSVASTLAKSAMLHQDAQAFIDHAMQVHLDQAEDPQAHCLSLSYLKQLDAITQRFLLRYWMSKHHVALPNEKTLYDMQRSIVTAKQDRLLRVCWQDFELRRYRNALYVQKKVDQAVAEGMQVWEVAKPLILPHGKRLLAKEMQGGGIACSITKVVVGFRRGGEKIYYHGHHRQVKKLFQESGVPPWERNHIPFIFFQDQLIAVGEQWIDERYSVKNDDRGWSAKIMTEDEDHTS